MQMFSKKILITSLLTFLFLNFFLTFVSAQIQTTPFSGNDASSYQCIGKNGQIEPNAKVQKDSVTNNFVCYNADGSIIDRDGNGKPDQAILKPVALEQIQIWFVRIIYVIWALVGTYSFLLLVYLGYQYMLRGGTSDEELVKLRKRIIYYVIGFALVFLAIPILSTVFRLLNINTAVDCYNVNIPTFQFFFATLCTDPNEIIVGEPCNVENWQSGAAVGLACPTNGEAHGCPTDSLPLICYYCSGNIWNKGTIFNSQCRQ